MHRWLRFSILQLQHGRQWLKRNGNTRAGTLAVLGGLSLGSVLCWCGLLLWLKLAPPLDLHRREGLEAYALALGMSTVVIGAFTLLASLFQPRTEYSPPRAIVVGITTACAFYMVVCVVVFTLVDGLLP